MRFMVLVKADTDGEAGAMPSRAEREAMTRFNGELVKAGVLLGGESLHPSSRGARVTLQRGRVAVVVDGPFAATREPVAGFWLWQARSREEAIEWARRIPATGERPFVVEIREVFEARDSGEASTRGVREREEPMRDAFPARP